MTDLDERLPFGHQKDPLRGALPRLGPRLVRQLGMSINEGSVPFEEDPPPAPEQAWTREAPEEATEEVTEEAPEELSALQRFIGKFRKS